MPRPASDLEGFRLWPGLLSRVEQEALRDEVFARLVEADPGWGEYQERTIRTLPVVALVQQPGPPPGAERGSFAEALKTIHAAFRRELSLIRHEVATAGTLGGGGPRKFAA